MPLIITRVYKNASDETLRSDEIIMIKKADEISIDKDYITYSRQLRITNTHGPSSRVIDSISIEGNYDSIETSSNNYTWATWTSPATRCDMSDLPAVGDTLS